ncbi:2,3,4,5-tetrahydropyridine-2,6-dicarboxylate N-acetyltransferase [Alkaliphilus hydrothermalis]|uniref:2,3,4,5-tetrahydropyridine-2,6-dicarboxylate N-acetyltransferase n=1 Tax=Alkaliphilus hydrothermalis TaxID=1482730 RepID=A0ABS2NSI3_9FIRM|nr:2,3,4,5-tetrahydropyridine-2,6-dicarboxylate N-acetyltransferase [Alkaliphilus hydrothermalis]MBM7615915.1 2,3,4,5-tetrahydropyridine-2-carboxylate N-succinyltransferase [Alkaliphilus hydrothermalis]
MSNHQIPPQNTIDTSSPEALAKCIKEAKKTTPVKVYIQGKLSLDTNTNIKIFGGESFWILMGEYEDISKILNLHQKDIQHYHLEYDRRNSAIPLLNPLQLQARIEPGAIIRENVTIGKNVVIMMGAVINVGAEIGDNTMVDMNCVVGARGIIGKNAHIGAGAVIAGVLEPPNKTPVIIEDDVFIGANAVVLEGVRVGKGAVVAAGSIVTKDVPPNTVVAGMPAHIIKTKDSKTEEKVRILEDLRG